MLPYITIIIPTLNEEEFIRDCVKSLICDSYPILKIEVLIVDGGSSDNTQEIVKSLQGEFAHIYLLENTKRTVPAAMNIGTRNASHPILVWCGSHAVYGENYLLNSVNTLQKEPDCASVGGVITPIAKTFTGKAIAIATSHKFGIGNALYRYANKKSSVDTVFGGCFYKSSVEAIEGFNEEWVRNQDYEFNFRLRKHVGKIILDPSIQCQYYCRESISQLAKQYFSYGYWRFRTLLKHPKSLTIRQTAPIALIFGLLISLLLILTGSYLGIALPISYGLINLMFSSQIVVKKKNRRLITKLPIIFSTLHLSWGAGFIVSALETGYNRVLGKTS